MVAMGADELAAAFHHHARSELSNIWNEALQDEDDEMDHAGMDDGRSSSSVVGARGVVTATAVSPSSSSASNSSSPGLPPQSHTQQQQQQQLNQQQALLAASSSSMMLNPAVGSGGFFYPMNANLHLNELSAFLASSAVAAANHLPTSAGILATGNGVQLNQTMPPAPSATPLGATFLDDLLSSTEDMDFRVRGGAQSSSSNSNSNNAFMPMHSLPPSIQQQLTQSIQVQRQLAAASSAGSLGDSPFLGLDGAAHGADGDGGEHSAGLNASGVIASRLLQLENNYERKKKRAKINRKDLNARFQELMDILSLKEDRKLNRAKILEKTIEYIEKLEDELHAVRSQMESKKAGTTTTAGAAATSNQQQPVQMLLQNPIGSHATMAAGGSLMAFDPATAHAWTAAANASSMPLGPMMWLPCSMVAPPPSSSAAVRSGAPNRARADKRSVGRALSKGTMPAATVSAAPVASSSAESVKRSLKRARENSSTAIEVPTAPASALLSPSSSTQEFRAAVNTDSAFIWSAQEIPTFLSFCDAWTLASVMQTSTELASAARQNRLWLELCRRRWRLGSGDDQLQLSNARDQWTRWHRDLYMPTCGSISSSGIRFASGRANGVHAWGLLARRSNGRTTRTVLLGGRATVMQVVELYVVLQNMSQAKVRLTDQIAVRALSGSCVTTVLGGGSSESFQPFTSGSGAHLTPHVISLNGDVCATKKLESVVLNHGDVCVLDVFLQSPGLDLEQEFLQRAGWLSVECTLASGERAGAVERVAVRAHCIDEQQKRLLIDAHYSSLDVLP